MDPFTMLENSIALLPKTIVALLFTYRFTSLHRYCLPACLLFILIYRDFQTIYTDVLILFAIQRLLILHTTYALAWAAASRQFVSIYRFIKALCLCMCLSQSRLFEEKQSICTVFVWHTSNIL